MTRSSDAISKSVLAAVLVLACTSVLPAQKKKDEDNTRTIQGIVLDPESNPVAHAAVQLKDSRTLQVISFITRDDGSYHFAGLKMDVEYQVKAESAGMSTAWKRLSVFDPRKIINLDLKLTKEKK
jgi:hypothetical protein